MGITNQQWMTQAACREHPDLFSAPALDYDPADPDYADLTPAEHAHAAAAKADAEQAAVSICFGCPVMTQCETWARRTTQAGKPVFGVVAGYTETQRAAWNTAGHTTTVTATPRDRGARGQIDDDTVERLTSLGYTAEQIAHEMGCAPRSVVRSRARVRARAAAQRAGTHRTVPQPATTPAESPARTATPRARTSAAMAAIYAVLADGQWHHRDYLLDVGAAHISPDEAINWWTRINQVNTPQGRMLNPAKAHVDLATRIADGARSKVNNMLTASCRNAGYTERGGPLGVDRDLYRLTAKAQAAGIGRRHGRQAVAA